MGQLEILLLLRSRRVGWTADAVARELRVDASSAAQWLGALEGDGFVAASELLFSYAATGELDRDIEALARCYSERRVSVITAIFASPSDPLRSFADAFRIRKGG